MATLRADMRPFESDDREPGGPSGTDDVPLRALPPLGPLPSGRHRFTPEQIAHHQRERLIAGLAATVAEDGYPAVTIGQIAAAAHVSRRVFYEHFASKDECFLAAFDVVLQHLRGLMAAAVAPYEGDWPRRVVASLGAALDFFAAEPDLARLCLVESPSAGPALHRRFADVATIFDPYLRVGRSARGDSPSLPDSTERSLVGALGARLNREISQRGAEHLPELLPDLTEFVLTPYLGTDEARRYASEAAAERAGGDDS